MMRSLLAWNSPYNTLELFEGKLLPRGVAIGDVSFSRSPLAGADVSVNPGFDFFAVPMPQAGSSKIVFTSNRDGNAEIYSMNVDGSSLARLTTNGFNDDHPRWSPDGTKILFQSDRDNPESGNADVYVMNANGTSQTRLTYDAADDSAAVWSPDGAKIVFQSLRNGQYYQVYVMNADGTNQLNKSNSVAADYQPSWSPDGAKIAFASERDHAGRTEVYVMNVNGTNQTRLTFSSDPFRDEQPAWTRDSTKIAFVSTRDSVIETWQETDDEGGILNRSRVRTNKEVYLMNADGSNQMRLTNTLENDDSPSWSPDGTQIIFRSDRERDAYDPTQQLWIMNASGGNQAILNANGFGDYSPSWNTSAANQSPIANPGGPYSGLTAQNVWFNAGSSFDSDGTITSYSWSFGDGGAGGTGASLSHAYTSAGTYIVTLTVTDNLGAQSSATTNATITTAGSEQYLANFNLSALARQPYQNESSYWNDILRAAYANGQNSMLLAMRELGKTLFESSEYAARNRTNEGYVYDLYKTYLMREPDGPGWLFWKNVCNDYGRDNVRRAFDESGEFAGIVGTFTPSGAPSSAVSSFASARVDPFNQPGNGLASRDTEWSVPLLSLPGRAGLDLGLSLSYSSMVWTRSGPYIYFDEDNGWPSSGFRLGFPTIQEKFFDAQAGDNVYLLIAGERVSLRQVGTSNVYEAADSSYLQLIDNGGSLLVRATDGTQLSYSKFNNEWRCTQIKDRNGNYLTVNYDWLGHITTIIDTLARTITFNYDTNNNLLSITQSWTVNGAPTTHTWASFGWATKILQPSFSGAMVVGAPGPSGIPVLSQVGLDDGTRYTFEYNAAGQVNPIRSYRSDNVQRAYTAYDYDSPAADCPRLIDTHTWAENWSGLNGVPQEVATVYGAPGDGSHTMTAPDGTLYKEFYAGSAGFQPASLWARGLVAQTEVWSAGVKQKWTTNNWTQDNAGVNYQTNPRLTETNVFDVSGNHRRTTTSYSSFTLPTGVSCNLPSDTREYASDASTVVRRTHVDYRMDPTLDAVYLDRHIVGLVKAQSLFEVNGSAETLMSKVGFQYDETGSILGADAPVRHDNSYDGNFVAGRANLSSVKRYDVNDSSQFSVSSLRYNTAGAVVAQIDPLSHQTTVSYADSFSDGNNSRNTLAYPKTVTDADGYSSTAIYNFDFGAVTSKQSPQPNTIANLPGPVQTFSYDAAGRLERTTATTNGAYTRYVYGPDYVQSFATVNTVADEAYSVQHFDGAGRVTLAGSNHPGSIGGYSARHIVYDVMGRAIKQSNPTEITGGWLPAGDDSSGWFYTQQTYDWKGRPLVTTNPDGTTKEAGYSGCGCAGGAVVTLTDEGTIEAGVLKRRQQKIYSDILGRTVKTEVLNWQGGGVYSATVNNYNGRDQVTLARQYAGGEGSITFQDTSMSYDGYGRPKTRHAPQQDVGTSTIWDYNADDTIQKVTDARGGSAIYSYNNNRGLVTGINYSAPAGITPTANVSFGYDAGGNRTSMTDGLGGKSYTYNQLSQMTSETRNFTNVGTFTLSYDYNLGGELKAVTDPWGATINYGFDAKGRLSNITGSGYGSVTQFLSNTQYRAWGTLKSEMYGNGLSAVGTYNNRLQMTTFQVNKPAGEHQISGTYQYHADGQVRLAHNALDERFDRAFAYDHAGRATQAYSGSQARDFVNGTQSSIPTGPFRQSYEYNPFNQVTQRTNRLWDETETTTEGFTNNRRAGWVYDADGRILVDDTTTYTRDAAGQVVAATAEGSSRENKLDGDGRMDWTSLTTQFRNHPRTVVTYYLTSAVLGGLAMAELNTTGQKTKSYVYAGGRKLAEESAGFVSWAHADPVTASRGDSSASGSFFPRAEYNSDGVNVGFLNPANYDESNTPEPGLNGRLLSLGSHCSVANPNCVTCYLDGFEKNCNEINPEATQQCPNNDCGPRSIWNSKVQRFVGEMPLTTDPDTGAWIVRGMVDEYSRYGGRVVDPDDGSVMQYEKGELKKTGSRYVSSALSPQNSPPFDRGQIKQLVNEALGKDPCAEFAKRILGAVSSKNNPALGGGDLAKVFEAFLDTGGDYTRVMPPGSAGYGSPIGNIIDKGGAIIFLAPATGSQAPFDAHGTIAELFHLAGSKKYYTDKVLSDAARAIPEYAALGDARLRAQDNIYSGSYVKGPKEVKDFGYSIYFHTIQRIKCPVSGLSQ